MDDKKLIMSMIEKNGFPSEDLDELVHEMMSKGASAINNAGIEAQVDFLLGAGLKVRDIVPAIDGNI